jgi:hypothetical protein
MQIAVQFDSFISELSKKYWERASKLHGSPMFVDLSRVFQAQTTLQTSQAHYHRQHSKLWTEQNAMS